MLSMARTKEFRAFDLFVIIKLALVVHPEFSVFVDRYSYMHILALYEYEMCSVLNVVAELVENVFGCKTRLHPQPVFIFYLLEHPQLIVLVTLHDYSQQ